MRLNEVGFDEDIIENLMRKPLLRDNLKNIEADFNSIYSDVFNQDIVIEPEMAVRMKSDLFVAFCHGMQAATRIESKFRQGYKCPKEFGGNTFANSLKL